METENNIVYRDELDKARKAVDGLARDGMSTTIDAYWEVCCGDVLVAEENMRNQRRTWENASLAKELLDIAAYLEGYDHMLDNLHTAISRMADITYEHPGLKLRLLEFDLAVLQRIEARIDHDLDLCEHIMFEISFYRRNIERADKGDFGNIEQRGHLKHDPIEWSAEYESIIDEAERKIDSLLDDHPRGMGFCFAYWSTKARVLHEDYGIVWRSPAIMNPGVIFD